MRDILYSEHVPAEPDPVKRAQVAMARQPLPRRFYKDVSISEEGGRYALKLDGRGAKTPARISLSLPTRATADIIAEEWAAQVDVINPDAMPATRMVNSALDGVANRMDDVRAEMISFAGSDLVCYRADTPDELVSNQAQHWDPIIAWTDKKIDAPFRLANGIIHQEQSKDSLRKITQQFDSITDPIALAALHVMTTISGSALIALMLSKDAISLEQAWSAATVDENWNISLWGIDDEAKTRLERRKQEFCVAHALWNSLN